MKFDHPYSPLSQFEKHKKLKIAFDGNKSDSVTDLTQRTIGFSNFDNRLYLPMYILLKAPSSLSLNGKTLRANHMFLRHRLVSATKVMTSFYFNLIFIMLALRWVDYILGHSVLVC